MSIKYEIDLKLVMDKPLGEIKNTSLLVKSKGGSVKAGVDQKFGMACMYVWNQLERLDFTSIGLQLTLRDFYQLNGKFGEEFIHIHRLNYMMYNVILRLFDYMEEKKLLNSNVKRYWKKIDKAVKDYYTIYKSLLDEETWCAVDDHMRLAFNKVEPLLEPLEKSIRDYLIQKRPQMLEVRQRDDITLLTKLQGALMFCAATRNSREDYFRRCIEKWGVDFSFDYTYTDLQSVIRNLVWMMEQLGVRFEKDKDNDYVIKGVDFNNSLRVNFAWDTIVNVVTDENIMDATALAAINMNPKVKADYEAIIAKEEEKELSQAIGDLSSKFKVSSL